jgi:hypothetical protein
LVEEAPQRRLETTTEETPPPVVEEARQRRLETTTEEPAAAGG